MIYELAAVTPQAQDTQRRPSSGLRASTLLGARNPIQPRRSLEQGKAAGPAGADVTGMGRK